MGGFFSLDSKFMQAMSRVADLIILNVIYLVTCLPVVTIGAAGTAMYTVCFRLGTDREGSLVKGYFRAFRDEFRQATLIWLFLLLFGAAACAFLRFCWTRLDILPNTRVEPKIRKSSS